MLFSFFLFFSVLAFVCGAPTSSAADAANPLDITGINVTITLEDLVTNLADLSFNVSNPNPFEITIDRIVVAAGVDSTEYISFDYTFEDPVVVPLFGTANSGDIEDVTLTQGGLATLNTVSLGYLDLLNLDLYLREATIDGQLGIPVNATGLTQDDVPTTYDTPFN
ncbi:uncharacterized protein BT62DRAFT_926124 [Guyanagaster necrorhizus]|uniref:Water stress and hypersensitive response domain-containing protein n=1 Tax=Guyanagaster necrorhizus TaxID=856835 RepID=A0A9P8AY67_9AGAR|nr:uncharacterized protein BT62DRAFT_926124 [Guyanagaster necrorhizus MCA 3950]KAG7451926.1 hypothetical protein BT62DRAFT_926124 [Guyanagaster necrorhizus MCA 3950]